MKYLITTLVIVIIILSIVLAVINLIAQAVIYTWPFGATAIVLIAIIYSIRSYIKFSRIKKQLERIQKTKKSDIEKDMSVN